MDRAPYVALKGADGSTLTLSSGSDSGNLFLGKGAKGLDMPPWDVQVDEYPSLDGEFPRAVRSKAREIFLPITAWGNTRAEARSYIRAMLRALNPARFADKMVNLLVAEPTDDGGYEPQKQIEVYYSSGMEGDEGEENGLVWQKYGLVLRSTDPFFTALQDTVRQFLVFDTVNPFFPAGNFLSTDGLTGGFKLSSAPVPTTSIVVNNPGDVGAYPTWTILGPLSGDFSLVRNTTAYSPGAVLHIFGLSLGAGQTATIVTAPGKLRASGSVGAGISWTNLGANPQFWALDPGDNTVSIEGLPVGVFPTQLTLTFRPKYLGV